MTITILFIVTVLMMGGLAGYVSGLGNMAIINRVEFIVGIILATILFCALIVFKTMI